MRASTHNLQKLHSGPRFEPKFVNGRWCVLDRRTYRQEVCRHEQDAVSYAAELNARKVH